MSQQRYVCRWGFSVLDLLAMVALLLLLMALMLPAIMRVRNAANRMKCSNNLSQSAIAFWNYHNDYNIFPSGGGHAEQGRAYSSAGKTERNPPLGGKLPDGAQVVPAPSQEWGWAYQILPYVEHHQVYRKTSDDEIRQTVIPIYFCPERRKPGVNEKNARGLTMAGIDYAGNGGVTGPAQKVDWLKQARYTPPYGDYTACGMVIRSSHWYPEKGPKLRAVSLDGGVPDGVSNTLLLAEKRMQVGKINQNPGNDDWSFVDGWGNDTIVRYHPEDEKLKPMRDNRDPVPDFAMGSPHLEAFIAVFTDRSVRRIRYNAKPEALAAIMIRDDGMVLQWQDLE
jgi:hypothetical protein